jgi:transposase
MNAANALGVAAASAALAGVFLLTALAMVTAWRLAQTLRQGQRDLLQSLGRLEDLMREAIAGEVAVSAEWRSAEITPPAITQELTSVLEQMRGLREEVKALSESRVSEVRDVAQTAGEMENTLKRLETAVALMADGVAAFIQRLEGERGSPET